MELYIIDFDKQFQRHFSEWLRKNKDNYKMDQIEDMLPEIYDAWSDTPAKWLDGEKPNHYFKKFDDPMQLIKLMVRYTAGDIGIPNPLLNRISELKERALEPLRDLFLGKIPLPKKADINEVQLLAVNLINEIDSDYLSDAYIETLKEARLDEGLADAIGDALAINLTKEKVEKILGIIKDVSDDTVKERYLDILANFPGHDGVFQHLLDQFVCTPDHKAVFASYLGKYGDERAIKTLQEALEWPDINYLDYLEIRHAIEELGEEVKHERCFDDDPYYESLKGVE